LASALLLTSCTKQMAVQARYEPQGESAFFDDHRVERAPIPGTVVANTASTPETLSRALLLRGQERYVISCSPCHGRTGEGNGPIVQSGFTKPEPLDSPTLRSIKIAALKQVIRDGKGVMAGYRGLMSSEDMFAIAHYVKALQLRSHVGLKLLNETDKAALDASKEQR
jgi:cytochrome c553